MLQMSVVVLGFIWVFSLIIANLFGSPTGNTFRPGQVWTLMKYEINLNLADDYLTFLALAGSSMKCSWEVMSPDNTSAIRDGFWLVGNLFTVLNICMLLWRKRRQKIVFPSYFLTVFVLYKWQIKNCFLAALKWSNFLLLSGPSWSKLADTVY